MGDKNNHIGHRKRMREDFNKSGFSDWQKHKVLEYLLYYTIPVADTNDVAHDIIRGCGGFVNVFNAPKEDLVKIKGVGEKTADYIRMIGEIIKYYNTVMYDMDNFVLNSETSQKYIMNLFDGKKRECFYMICLDSRNCILSNDMLFEGSFESMDIDIPKILRKAIKCDASYVVFAHNHPSGIAKPSGADIISTNTIERALHMSGIKLLDHIIVAGGKCVSMRDGYL